MIAKIIWNSLKVLFSFDATGRQRDSALWALFHCRQICDASLEAAKERTNV